MQWKEPCIQEGRRAFPALLPPGLMGPGLGGGMGHMGGPMSMPSGGGMPVGAISKVPKGGGRLSDATVLSLDLFDLM